MSTWSSIYVSQHEGCLHNVPVYRLVLTARRIMARRTSFSCVEWRNEAFVLNTWRPQFHLNPQESANIPKHGSLDGTPAHSLELSKLFCTLFCLRDTNVLLFVVVKVAGVAWSFELGDEGSFHLKTTKGPFEKRIPQKGSPRINKVNSHIPFSGRLQSSQWLQTICVPWCRWPRSWGFRNVSLDPPGDFINRFPSRYNTFTTHSKVNVA